MLFVAPNSSFSRMSGGSFFGVIEEEATAKQVFFS